MLCVRSKNLIDFLWQRGYVPALETDAAAYYKITQDLYMLMECYYIRQYCVPNKQVVAWAA